MLCGKIAWILIFAAVSLVVVHAQTESASFADEVGQDLTTTGATRGVNQSDAPPSFQGLNIDPGVLLTEPPPTEPSYVVANAVIGASKEWSRSGGDVGARILGNVDLLKFWRRSVTSLGYVASGSYASSEQIQSFTAAHAFLWRGKQLTIADSLGNSNAGGSFGSSQFGGGGLFGLIFSGTGAVPPTGLSSFAGVSSFGGSGSKLINATQGSYSQVLTERSQLNVSVGYGLSFYDGGGHSQLKNSRQFSATAQYSYRLNSRSTAGILYGYRSFRYPFSDQESLRSHVVQLIYQRAVSRRMNIAVGAGPEFQNVTSSISIPIFVPPLVLKVETSNIDVSSHASLNYSFKNSSLRISYQRLSTSGSGLFAGANSDIAQASLNPRIFRTWRVNFNTGYARLRQIQKSAPGSGGSYSYWYGGVGVTRSLGRNLSLVGSYQLNEGTSTNSSCTVVLNCVGRRSTALIGISWHIRPFRLDRSHGPSEQLAGPPTDDPSTLNTVPKPSDGFADAFR
jgi:hypothetical protein